jgi:hypothetical protein
MFGGLIEKPMGNVVAMAPKSAAPKAKKTPIAAA